MAGPGLLSTTPGAPHVLVAGSVNSLARIVAQRLVDALAFRLKDEWVSAAHVAMSGGVLTEAVIESVADSLAKMCIRDRTYTVQSGDTLWAIAERYYGDGNQYMKIASANSIANPDLINPGQVLVIP